MVGHMQAVRAPAVAGSFYPAAAPELAALVDRLLGEAELADERLAHEPGGAAPKALIVPHAGYSYSGACAAAAFARVRPFAEGIERVVLLGPAHRVFVDGLAWPDAERLRTPLGEVAIDLAALRALPAVVPHAAAHAREHSLEVVLPFLQRVCPRAKLVPLIASRGRAEEVGRLLEQLYGGRETLFVISTDLSHFLRYDEGRALDRRTAERIVALDGELAGDEACGAVGVNGLLWLARRKSLRVELVRLCSSGDTAGGRDEVVGYGAFALYEGP
jgi:MEMO1 family protein